MNKNKNCKIKNMKAKHFKRLRAEAKYYNVMHTDRLFGEFWMHKLESNGITVLAKNYHDAVMRAKKRGYGLNYSVDTYGTVEKWARWVVKQVGKPNNFRYVKHF